jgi:hypothetical protein
MDDQQEIVQHSLSVGGGKLVLESMALVTPPGGRPEPRGYTVGVASAGTLAGWHQLSDR